MSQPAEHTDFGVGLTVVQLKKPEEISCGCTYLASRRDLWKNSDSEGWMGSSK
jgi:hypothetical protein